MRILVLSPFVPYPLENGGAMRIFHLLRQLANQHEVVLLCQGIIDDSAADALRFCAAVHSVLPPHFPRPWRDHARALVSEVPGSLCASSPAFQDRLKRLMTEQSFDLVQVEFLGLAPLVRFLNGQRRVLVEHCITTELRRRQLRLMPWSARRLYYTADLWKLWRYERRVLRRFDGCITVSARDEQVIRSWVPGLPVVTVPNGVDTDYFALAGQGDLHTFLFVGSFHLDPANADGIVHFAREIFPRICHAVPEARLTVLGNAPPPEVLALASLPGVEVLGRVEDVRPYLARAALVVVPLRAGAGTKIRILAAMAMEKAVLATSMAAEGIEVVDGEELVIADGVQRLTAEAVALLRDASRRRRIGQAARARVVAQYDWRVIGRRLDPFYASLVNRETP